MGSLFLPCSTKLYSACMYPTLSVYVTAPIGRFRFVFLVHLPLQMLIPGVEGLLPLFSQVIEIHSCLSFRFTDFSITALFAWFLCLTRQSLCPLFYFHVCCVSLSETAYFCVYCLTNSCRACICNCRNGTFLLCPLTRRKKNSFIFNFTPLFRFNCKRTGYTVLIVSSSTKKAKDTNRVLTSFTLKEWIKTSVLLKFVGQEGIQYVDWYF